MYYQENIYHTPDGQYIGKPDLSFMVNYVLPYMHIAQKQVECNSEVDNRWYATELPKSIKDFLRERNIKPNLEYRLVVLEDGEFVRVATEWEDKLPEPHRDNEHPQTRQYWPVKVIAQALQDFLHERFKYFYARDLKELATYCGGK